MNLHDIDFSQYIPFVSLATAKAGEHVHRPITTRIVEGVIMGLAGGALGAYVSIKLLENNVIAIKDTIIEVKQDVRRLESFHLGK